MKEHVRCVCGSLAPSRPCDWCSGFIAAIREVCAREAQSAPVTWDEPEDIAHGIRAISPEELLKRAEVVMEGNLGTNSEGG